MLENATLREIFPSLDLRITRGNALVERIGDEVAIVDLSTHRVATLNAFAAMVWDCLVEPNTVGHCVETIQRSVGPHVPVDQIALDTRSFVASMLARGLLVPA